MKYLFTALTLAAAMLMANCTANSTLLGDTATSLSPATTSTTSSADEVLAKKLRSIWMVGGTKTAGAPAVATAAAAFAGDLDYYDPTTNTWTTITSAGWTGTYTPKLAAAVAGYNGKIYVLGGFAEGGANSGAVQIYDIATSVWTAGTALGTNLAVTAVTRVGTKIYLLNGSNNATATTAAYGSLTTLNIYDIANNAWSTGTALSVTGTEGCATNDGYAIFKVSGKSTTAATPGVSTTSYQSVNVQVSPTVNSLFGTGATATAVVAAACVWLPGTSTIPPKILMLGGYTAITASNSAMTPLVATTTMTPSANVQSTSFPYSGAFSTIGTIPTATAYGAAVYTSSGVFFFGGNTSAAAAALASSAPTNVVYASHPTLLFFQATQPLSTTAIPVMPTARWGHGAVVVQ